ncbi:MAG: ABC transporter permease [Chloroflexota bacterium]|nr:ABC transporter permease [Chloroflexota bacterium]
MSGLIGFVIKRILSGIVVVWAIVTVVFIMEHAPGTPNPIRLILGSHYTYGKFQVLLHEYGLDIPLWQQYLNYLGLAPILAWFGVHFGHGAVQTGLLEWNYGYSYSQIGTPVWSILSSGIPVTLKLGLYALVASLVVGIPVGMISALRQNTWLDYVGQGSTMILYGVPTFVLAPVLQIVFAIHFKWFPESGWGDNLAEVVLPVFAYAAGLAGYFAKSFRSFMLEVLQQDYIRTARAKGLSQRTIIILHAMKNTLLPLASIVGPVIAYLIVGAFIVEEFFRIPGIAYETVQSVFSADYGVIEGTTIALAVFVVFINMLTDIFYSLVDPRVRL